MENHDRPLISVKAPKDNAKVNFPKVPENFKIDGLILSTLLKRPEHIWKTRILAENLFNGMAQFGS